MIPIIYPKTFLESTLEAACLAPGVPCCRQGIIKQRIPSVSNNSHGILDCHCFHVCNILQTIYLITLTCFCCKNINVSCGIAD